MGRAQEAKEESARYGLLLALGEFSRDEILAEGGSQWLETLSGWYASDPSSAIHSACGWLLRQWDEAQRLEAVDHKPLPYDPVREWFVEEVKYEDGAESKAEYFTFIVFPPGQFQMGSPDTESGRSDDERLHTVPLPHTFAICDREITAAQFLRCPDALKRDAEKKRKANAAKYRADHPAVYVSWFDAVDYCRWLTERTKRTQCYVQAKKADAAGAVEQDSLPAWDFDPKVTVSDCPPRPNGNTPAAPGQPRPSVAAATKVWLSKYARFTRFLRRQTIRTATCALLRPNLRGLFDMHGNVWEWCNSWYDEDPLRSADPDFVGSARVLRGGSWFNIAYWLRSAFRYAYLPADSEYFSWFSRGQGSTKILIFFPFLLPRSPQASAIAVLACRLVAEVLHGNPLPRSSASSHEDFCVGWS